MKKLGIFITLFFIICFLAGLYGFLHDQISYTVSPEYFTKFKFIQFNIQNSLHNRIGAGIVGIRATWWMGLLIGIVLIPVGLIIPNWKNYCKVMLWAFLYVALTALITGIIALIYGSIHYSMGNLPYWSMYIPNDVENTVNYCIVGTMHNFSYIGGIGGIVAGIIYILIKNLKIRRHTY